MDEEQENFTVDDAVEAFFADEENDGDGDEYDVEEPGGYAEEEAEQSDEEESDGEDEDPDEDGDDEEGEDDNDDDNEDSEEDDSEDQGDDEEEGEEPDPVASDESLVEIEVDGEKQSVKVGDLKRLAGQEKSLTQKSQAVAEQRRTLDAQGMAISNILEARYNKAKERADKYKDVDLFQASRELDDDDFKSLRQAKEDAESELNQIENESKEFMQQAREARSAFLREQAKQSVQAIQEAIPEWNDQLYNDLRSYAVKQGMDQSAVNEIVDPAAIVMMHKAMKHDEATTKGKENVTKKVRKSPKRVTKKAKKVTDRKADKAKKARQKAQMSGDVDDITELFMSDYSDD